MGKFYCSYCQTYLTHDSTSVRRSHIHGRVHIGRYTAYYDNVLRQHPEYEKRQRLHINELREGGLTQTHNSRPQPRLKDVYKSIPGPKSYYHDGPAGGDSSSKQTTFRLPPPPTNAGLPPPPPNVYHERTAASASPASSTFSAVHRQHAARRHQQQQQQQRQQQQQQQQRW